MVRVILSKTERPPGLSAGRASGPENSDRYFFFFAGALMWLWAPDDLWA